MYEVRKRKSGNFHAAESVIIRSLQTLAAVSFLGRVLLNTKDLRKKEPELFKEEFRCLEMLCLYCKTYCLLRPSEQQI